MSGNGGNIYQIDVVAIGKLLKEALIKKWSELEFISNSSLQMNFHQEYCLSS